MDGGGVDLHSKDSMGTRFRNPSLALAEDAETGEWERKERAIDAKPSLLKLKL